ncbi:MAG TPA: condensation domain-containing protein [Terriglobia bacterium]|nr:condensation domain-containing protein [Terriglobia bacterium]
MMKLIAGEATTSQEAAASGAPDRSPVRSRPLLLMERTLYRDGHVPFTCVFSIKLRGQLDKSPLRGALRRLQSKHPLLRCVVEDVRGRPCFVLRDDPAPIPLRIGDRLSEDQWEEEVHREWINPFNGAVEPLVRLIWLRGSGIHNLILPAHHSICDGQGGIGLLQDLLRAYEHPESDPGSYDELGSLEDLVPPEVLQNPNFQRRLQWKRRQLKYILWLKTCHRTQPAPIDPESVYFHRTRLSTNLTQALAERSKAEHVTVFSPMALAFMQAFRDVRGIKAFKRAHAMVNARRFVPSLRPDGLFGLSPGVQMHAKDLPATSDRNINTFWKRARAIKSDLDQRVSHLGAGFYVYLAGLEGFHHRYDRVVDFFEQTPAIRNLTFSNLGRLELGRQYGGLNVEQVYSPLVMVSPTPAHTVVLSSFAGQMEYAIISDEASLPRTGAGAISCRVVEVLQACAGGSR